MLITSGDGGAGYDWFLQDGYVVFEYVFTREQRYIVRSELRVGSGTNRIGLNITKTGESSADVVVTIDDSIAATGKLPKLWPVYAPNAGLRCGENSGAPVSLAYRGRFRSIRHCIE